MYRLNEVAAVIEPENPEKRLATLRIWFHRGIISWSEGSECDGVNADRKPAKAGSAGKVSRFRAVQVATTGLLNDLGVPLEEAARIALEFSDKGTPTAMCSDQPINFPRLPSCLYLDGDTLLCAWREPDGAWTGRVINAKRDDPWLLVKSEIALQGGFRVIILDCKEVLEIVAPLVR